jgi:hypothetical protein
MVRRSAPASRRWEAQLWRLCTQRHSRHYLPFLTMSCPAAAPAFDRHSLEALPT